MCLTLDIFRKNLTLPDTGISELALSVIISETGKSNNILDFSTEVVKERICNHVLTLDPQDAGLINQLICQLSISLTLKEQEEVFLQILAGVEEAHNQGFIHRDLKPQNILIAKTQTKLRPKVFKLK